jgi:O-succinylbenzoic acid--CoA ligase
VVTTYGSSETAGGCVYDGVPLDGVAVTIGTDGRVRIAGPTLFSHYDDDPGLTAQTLVDGWFLTSDAGRLDEDGRLEILGRLDDVVISGGVKIPLPAVAERLRQHLLVEQAEVFGVPDVEWGQRLVAVVVGSADDADLRDWVSLVHPRSWAPREFVRVSSLPLLANGKVDRQTIRAGL